MSEIMQFHEGPQNLKVAQHAGHIASLQAEFARLSHQVNQLECKMALIDTVTADFQTLVSKLAEQIADVAAEVAALKVANPDLTPQLTALDTAINAATQTVAASDPGPQPAPPVVVPPAGS